jgi:hypothetical protein
MEGYNDLIGSWDQINKLRTFLLRVSLPFPQMGDLLMPNGQQEWVGESNDAKKTHNLIWANPDRFGAIVTVDR